MSIFYASATGASLSALGSWASTMSSTTVSGTLASGSTLTIKASEACPTGWTCSTSGFAGALRRIPSGNGGEVGRWSPIGWKPFSSAIYLKSSTKQWKKYHVYRNIVSSKNMMWQKSNKLNIALPYWTRSCLK